MAAYDFNLITIGGGSGGVRASRMAAAHGARVCIVEEKYYGGTCVNVGCIPKKLFGYAAHFKDEMEDAAGFGWDVADTRFDWARLVANKDREIARLNGIYVNLLTEAGVAMRDGRATLTDAHTIEVATEAGVERITGETILIATGGKPHIPDIAGAEHAVTSDEAFHLESLPKRAIVVGGGYIALEFACIFDGLGVAVTTLYRGEQILRGFDRDVRDSLADELRKKGIDLRLEINITAIEKTPSGLRATLTDGTVLDTDLVMFATGRIPNTTGLGLDAAGVAIGQGAAIEVDTHLRSSQSNIYALGDVTDRLNLTPTAIKEGAAFAETVFGGNPTIPDLIDVPTAVFTHPPVATVGLSEEDARARYDEIDIYRSSFRPLKHTLSGRDETAMMKLVVERASQRVLGAHMVGADAPEIIQGMAIAVKCQATKAQLDSTVGIHPTAAEEFVTMRTPARTPASTPARAPVTTD